MASNRLSIYSGAKGSKPTYRGLVQRGTDTSGIVVGRQADLSNEADLAFRFRHGWIRISPDDPAADMADEALKAKRALAKDALRARKSLAKDAAKSKRELAKDALKSRRDLHDGMVRARRNLQPR